ncbi:hypothetical protein [Amycolatopsis sp. FDAARGOS 1241]|uniref:hypothetical protein n=1 Tax=Amycolatopsis sp. FDAARGOS 1241 TaxID=2778070 RepID=UPI001950877F|nr:hypothetical protein [Amycolatopsis sp. FDAARGOS 1241]QRP49172.1 hypothetical protein I6J71_16140 [Amycolatopsis sp. FDAARGOS 1241]
MATRFATGSASFMRLVYTNPIGRLVMLSPEKGARQLVWLATTAPGADWESGVYYERGRRARRVNPQRRRTTTSRAACGTGPPSWSG